MLDKPKRVCFNARMRKHVDALTRLQALVREAGSQKAAAAALGCSAVHVGDLLAGRRTFSDRMLAKLRLRRIVVDAALLLILWLPWSSVVYAQDRPRVDWTAYSVMVAGNVADLVTTQRALSRGGIEANPILGSRGSTITVRKAGLVAGVALGMRWLETHGHPRAARILGYVDGGAMLGLALRNARVGRWDVKR